MTPAEVAKLFVVISYYDTRHQANEGVILAWHQSLNRDMPYEFARDGVYNHYANKESMIQPSHLNNFWMVKVKNDQERERGKEISRQLEEARANAVPIEVSKKYLEQIRQILHGQE